MRANSTFENDYFTIECKDVYLREYTLDDLEKLHALTWQPEIHENLPGWNVSKEQRENWLINYEIPENKQFLNAVSTDGNIGELRFRLGIISKESGEFIGWCCTGIKDDLLPPIREIMFAISKDHRGQGYTTQAAQGIIKYLFDKTNIDELHAIALIRNIPSNRVIQKCGFELQNIIEIDNENYNYYKLSKSSWSEIYGKSQIGHIRRYR